MLGGECSLTKSKIIRRIIQSVFEVKIYFQRNELCNLCLGWRVNLFHAISTNPFELRHICFFLFSITTVNVKMRTKPPILIERTNANYHQSKRPKEEEGRRRKKKHLALTHNLIFIWILLVYTYISNQQEKEKTCETSPS